MLRHWTALLGIGLSGVLSGCAYELTDFDADGFSRPTDCDDWDPRVHPGAPELCNGEDDDCNGEVDDDADDVLAHWADADGDGFGAGSAARSCDVPAGRAPNDTDCDDGDPATFPGAPELCDDADRDCDGDPYSGAVDEREFYVDDDGDGYGGTAVQAAGCAPPDGMSANPDDCDDDDPDVFPGATEHCDGVDQDCDGGLGFDFVVGTTVPDLTTAFALAHDDDTVCLPPGAHVAGAHLAARRLTVSGAGRDLTRVTSAGGRVLDLTAADLALSDLTLSGGVAGRGALVNASAGSLSLTRVDLAGASPSTDRVAVGLALALHEVDVTLRDVAVRDIHVATGDERVGRGSIIDVVGGTLHVEGLRLHDLTAEPDTGWALVHVDSTTVVIRDLDVRDVQTGGASYSSVVGARDSDLDLAGVRVSDSTVHGVFALYESNARISELDLVDIEAAAVPFSWRATPPARLDLWRLRIIDVDHRDAHSLLSLIGDFTLENAIIIGSDRRGPAGWGPTDGVIWWRGSSPDAESRISQVTLRNAERFEPCCGFVSATQGRIEVSNVDLDRRLDMPVVLQSADVTAHVHDLNVASGEPVFDLSKGGTLILERAYSFDKPGYVDISGMDVHAWDLTLRADSPLRDVGDPDVLDVDGTRSDIGAYGGPRGGPW